MTPTASAAPAPTVERGEQVTLVLNGRTLGIGESGPVKTPTFTYYRTRISTVGLTSNRLGFSTAVERKMIFRTSIGPMSRPLLAVSDTGAIVAGAHGKAFAGPVVWCCTPGGEEEVVYSDGNPAALPPRGVAFDGEIPRALIAAGSAAAIIERLGDGNVQRENFVIFDGPTALGAQTLAEVDFGYLLRTRLSAREGPIGRLNNGYPEPPPPGTIRGLWMDGDRPIALVQRVRNWELYRYDDRGGRKLLLRTAVRPANIAVGRRSLAASVGRTIWAAQRNRKLTPQNTARSAVRALAVDGTRVAWLERRGALQVVRLGRVR